MAHRSIGLPASFVYCFGVTPPARLPEPAATIKAMHLGIGNQSENGRRDLPRQNGKALKNRG
jgi:hypothetical protein